MSLDEIGIWDNLSEESKAKILGNKKIPRHHYTHANFHYLTLVDSIKASTHQYDFGETNNYPSNVDHKRKNNYNYGDENDSMIINKLYKRDKVYPEDVHMVLYRYHTYYTQKWN